MAVDKTPSQVATSALQAIPFGSIIGGPLKACVEAQALAAKTTWEFIQNVGINVNPETGEKTAVNVSFSFIQGGRLVQLNIPLLTIVPIPYIAIREVDINFKANISASSSTTAETNESVSKDAALKASASMRFGCFKMNADMNASYSSKKDSKATSDSKVQMPDGMYGRWKSSAGRPDITLGTDSIGSFAIVHHRIYDGKICPVRYPLHLNSPTKGYIRAEGCILFYYDSLKCVLYFSPGGDYTQ